MYKISKVRSIGASQINSMELYFVTSPVEDLKCYLPEFLK